MPEKKIFATKNGFEIIDIDIPQIGVNDVLVRVISSFYSPGTEEASANKLKASFFTKAITFRKQVLDLLHKQDFTTLIKKIKNQQTASSASGYSIFGQVIATGENVNHVRKEQFIVGLGEKANHGSIAVVPQGLVFPCENNSDFGAVALVSIALNSVLSGNFKPFSRILVLGGGLLGQFIIQILKSMGHSPSVIEIRDELRNLSLEHGAENFLKIEDCKFYESKYDALITTLPSLSNQMWEDVLFSVKSSSSVVLVGAGDLNLSRSIFYSKRLKFVTAYSYGSGRGEFEYEQLGKHNLVKVDSGYPIHEMVSKSLKLIKNKVLSTKFIDTLHIGDNMNDLEQKLKKRNLGFKFIWFESDENLIINNKLDNIKNIDFKNHNFQGFDLIGDSAFYRDSHKPSLDKLSIKINSIKTRSPKGIIDPKSLSPTNSVIISTPHIEHWNNVKKSQHYKYIFVDKPLVTIKKDCLEYLKNSYRAICLMNRRFSSYTQEIKTVIDKNPSNAILNCHFNVPKMNTESSIFYSGGRLIGEMCHHLDLAIYLNGSVKEFKKIIIDNDISAQKSEELQLVLIHENGSKSNIFYNTSKSPFWKKEAVWVTIADYYLLTKDFAEISGNIPFNKINETDKGCLNMWTEISKKISNDSEFKKWSEIDLSVYELISKILF